MVRTNLPKEYILQRKVDVTVDHLLMCTARAMVDLIREFLEFYDMEFTLSVFLHEANIVS